MKVKYLYQQLGSHIGVLLIAFLILSLLFTQFVEKLVYENKIEELTSYGYNILLDLENNQARTQQVLQQYGNVLAGREIQYSLFDTSAAIIYSKGSLHPEVELTNNEWRDIKNGKTVIIKKEFRRFEQGVTFVLLPYVHNDQFMGGILLVSPIKGSRDVIDQINRYLFYTVIISLAVALLVSWIISAFHVKRIKRIREATALVAAGDYSVQIPSSNFDEIGDLARDFNKMVGKLHVSMEEIESLENRRRQFMVDVSHELRTPLTTISGVIEGIRNDMIPESEKEKGMLLASKESKRLIRLVNENLDYEKIRSNQVKLFKEETQLFEVLEIIKDQLEMQAQEKNNEIIVDVDDNVYIYADYDRLTQILINITKNSIQFTENGKITLRGKAGTDETIIEIEDTGIGIDPAEIEKIWGRFYKAMLSRTTNPYGEFGLGLSIVKQLVMMHQGNIEVTSEKGKGTKFIIRFPVKKTSV
ncbi:sensor histidine kinase [Lederbergia lenta]|uniref:histidine kinase n=1 Tax=Lederbergia lenta TaxID=1467 RepID=A0A2X4VL54_LEDLE|nr:HAMP domain-containing sensor histidine kinase [Lederbergia lenta]MCM3112618.1 HAMP domain-containing histidine kinase [Lederbergia lenta]MEC2323656.1 HAMP domain-containing sensor histidine kinase [Lederbergia lenta]SQI51713.1 histidine kinase, homodimeric YclK [Lederbergia lenta]